MAVSIKSLLHCWLVVFGLLFLAGMGLWMLVLPHLCRTTVMFIGIGGLNVSIFGLTLINGLADNPAHVPDSSRVLLLFLLILVVLGVLLLSGFTPSSLTDLAAISELLPGRRGSVMGLYSVVMGIGQLLGASLGGLFVDLGGFYGLMVFSVALGLISLGSVLYIRKNGHDLIKNQSSYSWSTSDKFPSYDISKPKVLGKIHRMPVMSDNIRNYTLQRENEK